MKKKIAFILSALLIVSMSFPVFAESEAQDYEVIEVDPIDALIESLDPTIFSGAYMNNDGQISFKTVDENSTGAALSRARNIDPSSIAVERADYSLDDLFNGKKVLLDQAEALNITAVGLDPSINGLAVYLPDPSEESKTAILQKSSIPNIAFYSNGELGIPDLSVDEDIAPEAETRVVTSISAGVYLFNQASTAVGQNTTLGYKAILGTQKGYITCGHNWSNGQSVYYNAKLLGKISKWSNNRTADACFIPESASYTWDGLRVDKTKASKMGAPKVGSQMIFDGAKHFNNDQGLSQRVTAKIRAVNVSASSNGQNFDNFWLFGSLYG